MAEQRKGKHIVVSEQIYKQLRDIQAAPPADLIDPALNRRPSFNEIVGWLLNRTKEA